MNKPTEEEHGSTRGRGSSSSYTTGDNRPRGQISEEVQMTTDRPQTRVRCRTQMRLGDVIPQIGVMRIKEEIIPATRTGGKSIMYQHAQPANRV